MRKNLISYVANEIRADIDRIFALDTAGVVFGRSKSARFRYTRVCSELTRDEVLSLAKALRNMLTGIWLDVVPVAFQSCAGVCVWRAKQKKTADELADYDDAFLRGSTTAHRWQKKKAREKMRYWRSLVLQGVLIVGAVLVGKYVF